MNFSIPFILIITIIILTIKSSSSTEEIDSLESLFKVVKYYDNNNKSSPCLYTENDHEKRETQCHRIVSFEEADYEKSIDDLKKLILNRLNLKEEPNIEETFSDKSIKFINQLEHDLIEDNHDDNDINDDSIETTKKKSFIIKTEYDKKESKNFKAKMYSSMYEATR
jgi:hypothetical protein